MNLAIMSEEKWSFQEGGLIAEEGACTQSLISRKVVFKRTLERFRKKKSMRA